MAQAAWGRVVIAVAPNGGRKTKADHPALPLTPDELARAAAECLDRGHVHVRDAEGRHILEADAYRAAIERISEAVGDRLVVQITSESLGRYSSDEQKAVVLKAKPEAVSLALCEFAPEHTDEAGFGEFVGRLKHMRIWPQIILYSADEAARLGAMRERGLIPFDSLAVLYVLGRFALLRAAAPSASCRISPPACRGLNRGASAPSAGGRPPA